MKKVAVFLSLLIFGLVGCQTTNELGIVEVSENELQVDEATILESSLQKIHIDDFKSYIVFHNSGDVVVNLEEAGDTVIVHFGTDENSSNEQKHHVYELTVEPEHEAIEVHINGELTPFERISL